ncbi:MAG: alpha/beta fold hydrolase [Candidatus Eiseniibacteriota bacterium]
MLPAAQPLQGIRGQMTTPHTARPSGIATARLLAAILAMSLAVLGVTAAAAAPAAAPAAAGTVKESGHSIAGPGGNLYVEIRGQAPGVPLFMVNGGPGFAHNYVHCSNAWDEIAKRRRVVFYDQRGVGRSAPLKSGQSCTLADQIADLEAVRASVGADKIDLLGHSWGGYLVMAYTACYPQHIRHLMIVDSAAPKWDDTVFLFKDVFPEAIERQNALGFAEALGDSAAYAEDIHEYLQLLFLSQDNRDRYMAHASEYTGYSRNVNEVLNADLKRFDLNPELPKFKCPTMVMCGRYDMNVAPSVAWKIHLAIPNSQFVVFEKSGHLPYFEEPDKFTQTVEDFLGAP